MRESMRYVFLSPRADEDAPHTTTGVSATEAASEAGPVTAELYEPTMASLPDSQSQHRDLFRSECGGQYLLHSTGWRG
eukprot:3137956-Rhodomonas_salina.1